MDRSTCFLLRCPVVALPTERLRCPPTAATRSGRLTPPPAALPSLPGCGALQKLRLTEQARFLQTAAHAYAPLQLPLAARSNAAIPNTEVKLMYADNSSKHKIQCSIFRKRKIPSVSWLFLSPQRPPPLRGPHFSRRLPGKIGNANTDLHRNVEVFLYIVKRLCSECRASFISISSRCEDFIFFFVRDLDD